MVLGLVGAGHYNIAVLVELPLRAHLALQRRRVHRQEIGLPDYDILAVDQLGVSLLQQVDSYHAAYGVGVLLFPVLLGDGQGYLHLGLRYRFVLVDLDELLCLFALWILEL